MVRQILQIKRMMAQSYTIEQIQREFLFKRSELQQLVQTLSSIFSKLDLVVKQRRRQGETKLVVREIADARSISQALVSRLEAIESRLTSPVGIGNAAVS